MRAQRRAQWEGMYGAFGGQAFPFIYNNRLASGHLELYNIYEACICCRQGIKCNKCHYISSGLIRPGVMAISVTLANETSRAGQRAEDKRKL